MQSKVGTNCSLSIGQDEMMAQHILAGKLIAHQVRHLIQCQVNVAVVLVVIVSIASITLFHAKEVARKKKAWKVRTIVTHPNPPLPTSFLLFRASHLKRLCFLCSSHNQPS